MIDSSDLEKARKRIEYAVAEGQVLAYEAAAEAACCNQCGTASWSSPDENGFHVYLPFPTTISKCSKFAIRSLISNSTALLAAKERLVAEATENMREKAALMVENHGHRYIATYIRNLPITPTNSGEVER